MPDYPFWCRRIEKEIQFCLKTIYIRNHDFSGLSSGLRDIYICQSTFFPLRFFVYFLKQNISIISKLEKIMLTMQITEMKSYIILTPPG